MTDANKNILITPNVGAATVFPKIEFTGFDNNTITLSILDDGTLSFDGSSGQLFSVSDSLSGTIFSVNDVSGIPSIEVIDDGTVIFAEFSGNVGVGYDTPVAKLTVSNDALFGANVLVTPTENTTTAFGIDSGATISANAITSPNAYFNKIGAVNGEYIRFTRNAVDIGSIDSTGTDITFSGSAASWTTGRTITLTGDVTGTSAAWDGSGNISIATTGGGGGASVTVATTPPGSPTEGDLYWDEDNGRMYIYYTDADSSQWVDSSPPVAGQWIESGTDLYSNNSGNVGVGIPVPTSKFHVVGTVNLAGATSVGGNLTIDAGTSSSLTIISDDGGQSVVTARGSSQGTGVFEVGQSTSHGGGMSYNGDGTPAWAAGESSDRITFYRLDAGVRTRVFDYSYNSNTVNFASNIIVGGTVTATPSATLLIINSVGTTLKTINGHA